MTEAQFVRAAKAIKRVMAKTGGKAGPWTLARAALMAAGVSHETVTCEGERVANSISKAKSLRERAIKAAAGRVRLRAARAAAQLDIEDAIAATTEGAE